MSAVIYNDARDGFMADYKLSLELKAAKETWLWKWLTETYTREGVEAQKALVLVNPTDTKEIMRLQLIAQRCLGLEAFVDAFIEKGEQAEAEFNAFQQMTGGEPTS